MYVSMFCANTNWSKADDAVTQWKRSAELHKNHPDVIDARVFRRAAGKVHVLFMMITHESEAKHDSYVQSMPAETRQDFIASCESGPST